MEPAAGARSKRNKKKKARKKAAPLKDLTPPPPTPPPPPSTNLLDAEVVSESGSLSPSPIAKKTIPPALSSHAGLKAVTSPPRRATIVLDELISPPMRVVSDSDGEKRKRKDTTTTVDEDLGGRRFSRSDNSSQGYESGRFVEGDPSMRRVRSAHAMEYTTMSAASSEESALHSFTYPRNIGLERFEYGEPDTSDASQATVLKRPLLARDQLRMRSLRDRTQGRIKRSQSTGQLPERRVAFFAAPYSEETRTLLRQRTNSHFLPSSLPLKSIETQKKRVMAVRVVGFMIQMLLSMAVIYTSFANIQLIMYWNPYVKVTQFAGRMLFPFINAAFGITAADYTLWMGSQLGYYRALGRFSGTYRKLIEQSRVPQGDSAVEFILNQLHWLFDFLYFPTEHLALVEWEAVVFGIKSKLFFERINAVVWYWRQVFMVCLLLCSFYYESLGLDAFPATVYFISVIADLCCAYAFLPLAKRRPHHPTEYLKSWCVTRTFTLGLGLHGFLGVTEGLCQLALRWVFTYS